MLNKLKAYVRFDGTGRIIPGSLILNRFKPKVGDWQEINSNQCCNSKEPLFPIEVCNRGCFERCSRPLPIVYIPASCSELLTVGCKVWSDLEGNIPYTGSVFTYKLNAYYLTEGEITEKVVCE